MLRARAGALPVCLLCFSVAACGADGNGDGAALVRRDTIGDTIAVHTVRGSAWGAEGRLVTDLTIGVFEGPDDYVFGAIRSLAVAPDGSVLAFDAQAMELRKYAPDGAFVGAIGREGGGPGEYRNPDGGVAVTRDGRILLRDPGNGRINVYSADGETLGAWRIHGTFSTSRRLYADTAGNVYSLVHTNPTADITERRFGLVRYGHDGPMADTLETPVYDEPPALVARREQGDSRMTSTRPVPFAPGGVWAYSPLGYFVGGLATRYAIDLYRPDGVLRIGRDYEPVAIQPQEREDSERRTTDIMRSVDPAWRWNGPPIPETKPPYRTFFIGEDGRIWVQLYQEARPLEIEESEAEPGSPPPRRWVEPPVFDVFEPDGRYLGLVRGAEGLSLYPTPTARGDTLWAVVRDELDVQYIQRLHIELEGD